MASECCGLVARTARAEDRALRRKYARRWGRNMSESDGTASSFRLNRRQKAAIAILRRQFPIDPGQVISIPKDPNGQRAKSFLDLIRRRIKEIRAERRKKK